MYRNYTQCRACGCNNMNSNQQDLIDDTCDYVQNTMALQEDNCECGFDEEDMCFLQIQCLHKAMYHGKQWIELFCLL